MTCRSDKPASMGNIRHIRVYVRPKDVPRWNRIFEKAGKKSNTALLEWLMQLAEERLSLNAEQSKQEWNQEMTKIQNREPRPAKDQDELVHDDSGDNAEEMDMGQPPDVIQNGSLFSSGPPCPTRQDRELAFTRNISQLPAISMNGTGFQDPPRRTTTTKRTDSLVGVMDEQITVEKKGSNAPIRKRFRLRVSSVTSDVPPEVEASHQTFREPPKVRRKLERSISVEAAQPLPRTLRSREKPPQSTGSQPKRNSGSKTNPELATISKELRKTPNLEHGGSPNAVCPAADEPPAAPARLTTPAANGNGEDSTSERQQTWTCSQCPRVFKSAMPHRRHESAHRQPTRHACDSCDKSFTTAASLWHHRKSKHEEKNLPCPHCPRRFSVQRLLKIHLRKHTGEKPYKCKYCEAKFTLRTTLRNHESTHSALKHYLCDMCGQSFRRKDNLRNHVARRHRSPKVYTCNICGKTFNVKNTFKNHQIHHQNEQHGQAPYKCNQCDKEFTTPNGHKDHLARHRLEKDHVCETCGKVFKMKYYLTKHQAIHLKVKPYVCTTCDRRFTQKSNLEVHRRTHTGVKPYVCTVCGKAFAHNISLKTHASSCHSGSGVKMKPPKDAASSASNLNLQKKTKNVSSISHKRGNAVSSIEISAINPGVGFNEVVHSSSLTQDTDQATENNNLKLADDGRLPLVEQRALEESMEVGRKDEISDLVIDEHQYSHDLPDLNNPIAMAGDHNSRDAGIPQDISYSLSGLLPPPHSNPSSHNGHDRVQYVNPPSSLVRVGTSRTLVSARPENSIDHQSSNLLEPLTTTIPSHHSHLQGIQVLPELRGYNYHSGNLGAYTRQPVGSPALMQVAPSSLHQQQENGLHLPLDQSHLSHPLSANVSSQDNLSPAPMVPQNDAVSPLPPNLQVDNTVHQAQPAYPQNINFIPGFHAQPQPLTLTAQSAPLLPNMIRKEQPVLLEGLPQNIAAMIPIRALPPETSVHQMAPNQRLNFPAGNLQASNQPPVHFPYRPYIEYSQSPGEPPQDRAEDLPVPVSHFNKPQTSLPPSRMTPARQGYSYSTNYIAAVSSTNDEQQARGATPSFVTAAGQRSPAFVNSGAIENVKGVIDGVMVQGGETGGWRPLEARWDTPHMHHQIQGRDMGNIPPQMHRQLLDDFSRKRTFPTAVSTQQLVWEPASNQGLG